LALLHSLMDLVLHLDRHLADGVALYHAWIYGIVFVVIFAETGLVVTPFLPGDSLLFATGALAAVDPSGTLRALPAWALVAAAAILGNTSNYAIGRCAGPKASVLRLVSAEHLRRTEEFFARYGALTVLLSRFVPILRTLAPFVAGVGRMPLRRFQAWNIAGGLAWTTLFIWSGYLFGNIPVVKRHFGLVTLGVIAVSLVPLAWAVLGSRAAARSAARAAQLKAP